MSNLWIDFAAMWPEVRLFIGCVLCVLGAVICVIGAVGMLRFPDFYTRMHAASIIDTGGAGLLLVGMMFLPASSLLVIFKLALILLFIALTSPTGSHAIANAAFVAGLRPVISKGDEDFDALEEVPNA